MKINRKSLLTSLSQVVSVADKTATPPILGNVLVTAVGDAVEIVATDTRTTVSATVEASSPKSFTVPAQDFHAIVGGLDGDEIAINVLDGKIEIKCGGSKFTLASNLVADFPAIPKFDASKAIEVSAAELVIAIDGTAYAASQEKAHLAGVFLEVKGDDLVAVSTDGYRMALQHVKTPWPSSDRCMVSAGAARAIAKLIDGNELCCVSIEDEVINVRSGNSTLSSKLIQSSFIPYQQFVIGDGIWTEKPAMATRAMILSALKRMMLVKSTQKDRIMLGDVVVSQDKIELFREDQLTKAEETITTEGGTPASVHCNFKYLADAIEHVGSEDIEIHASGELEPINIRDKSRKQISIVMPTRK
jgi:DNA polymerase-3 subunit beta